MLRVCGDAGAIDGATAAMGEDGRRLADERNCAHSGAGFHQRDYGDAVILKANPGVLIVAQLRGLEPYQPPCTAITSTMAFSTGAASRSGTGGKLPSMSQSMTGLQIVSRRRTAGARGEVDLGQDRDRDGVDHGLARRAHGSWASWPAPMVVRGLGDHDLRRAHAVWCVRSSCSWCFLAARRSQGRPFAEGCLPELRGSLHARAGKPTTWCAASSPPQMLTWLALVAIAFASGNTVRRLFRADGIGFYVVVAVVLASFEIVFTLATQVLNASYDAAARLAVARRS